MTAWIACCWAGVSGFFLMCAFQERRAVYLRQRRLRQSIALQGGESAGEGVTKGTSSFRAPLVPGESFVIRSVRRRGMMPSSPWLTGLARQALWRRGLEGEQAQELIAKAGLEDAVSLESVCTARVCLSAFGMGGGLLAGMAFSPEAAALFACIGLVAGYESVPRALRQQAAARTADMERHLSEMLEVVMLGLQSGLSFERAFGLYPRYFATGLGDSMSRAMRKWELGLMTREQALRGIEAEYDSVLLSRVIASMVRSMRFGTSVSATLEAAASDARDAYRSRLEEKVAKAAVKMMLPVGTLILPAMLILVLGPVVIELIEGF